MFTKPTNTCVKRRCLAEISKRCYWYEHKYSFFFSSRTNSFRDPSVNKKMGDGFNTCNLERWCDGPFISHYNKEPTWWGRTVIRHKRFAECELWENGEKEHFLSLGLPKEVENEVSSMFQTLLEERGRPADLAERIKLAYQGELEIDDSSPPLPPIVENDYDALRVKFRYFARASGSNAASMVLDCGSADVRGKMSYIFNQYPAVAQCDFDVLAFVAALETCGGPSVPYRFGRTEEITFQKIIPDPETQSAVQIRSLFPSNTFNDQQIVALCGLNHLRSSGVLSSSYFENAPKSLTKDGAFKDVCEKYSTSFDFFNIQLHDAVLKMTELGVPERNWCADYGTIFANEMDFARGVRVEGRDATYDAMHSGGTRSDYRRE